MTFDPTLYAGRIREHRGRLGLTQDQLAGELVLLSVRLHGVACGANDRLVRSWERGEKRPGPHYRRLLLEFFATSPADLGFRPPLPPDASVPGAEDDDVKRRRFLELSLATALGALDGRLDAARRAVDLALARDPIGLDIDEWERTLYAYSRELASAPPDRLLANLLADFEDLAGLLDAASSDRLRREIAHVAGQLACLIAHTLAGLGEHQTARRWWRTARAASDEAGDPGLATFVRGQQAMLTLYGTYTPTDVLQLAEEAEAAAHGRATAGLAEALGARAQVLGLMGRDREAREALHDLSVTFDRLPDVVTGAGSSLYYGGWPEHRLRHIESYTHTQLRDCRRANVAQDQALALYEPWIWRGPAQVRLHRAACLVADGDVQDGVAYAANVLHALPAERRHDGLLRPIAHAAAAAVPGPAQRLPAVREYKELLALAPGQESPS